MSFDFRRINDRIFILLHAFTCTGIVLLRVVTPGGMCTTLYSISESSESRIQQHIFDIIYLYILLCMNFVCNNVGMRLKD